MYSSPIRTVLDTDLPTALFDAEQTDGAFAVLDQFSVIDAVGPDAAIFLHNQLTNDIKNLDHANARLAGLCSPKGRLLASFLVWRGNETNPDALRLMLSADLQTTVQKRLSMFILRSKVKLVEASPHITLVGFIGAISSRLSALFPILPDTVYGKVNNGAGALIRLTDIALAAAAPYARYLWIVPRPIFETHVDILDTKLARLAPISWDWLNIRAGEPRITAATQEQFVPQMVNFEVIGGVDFRKGCYPGQETVARLQYRGVVRRRMLLAHGDIARVGEPVFHSEESTQPCGMVVNAAAAPAGGIDCLVVLKCAALGQGTIHAGAPDGPMLTLLTLPYPLPNTA